MVHHLKKKQQERASNNDVREDPIDYIPGVQAMDPKNMTSYLQDTDTSTVRHQIIFRAFDGARSADFVLCNTVEELEPETISALQAKMPFYSIGPIFPSGFTKINVATNLWSESDCTQWLNNKPRGSVLYISFGSYAHVSEKDLKEIANGLSLSKVNFVWVLRSDIANKKAISQVGNALENALKPNGSSEKNMGKFIKDLKAKIQEKYDILQA
ncbi:udp-glycosyltransferase 86a2 [Quercus suber]|uniref:Udp-glycosyltransferase 86a2 n=1 Tax=Quercus suber TaxID=58331 RepID=A0AAW0KZ82_QUESU